jgi:type I restriction-modification system DNA methylase subunit
MMSQNISKSLKYSLKNPNDVIYTPKELAINCINSFDLKTNDTVLDPFFGNGIFFNNYPDYVNKQLCEIEPPYNKDFFKFNEQVDYIISNPPFSKINNVLEHTIEITKKGFGYILAAHNLTEKRVKFINNNNFGITGFAFYWVKEWFGFPVIFIKCEKNKNNNFLFESKNYGSNN